MIKNLAFNLELCLIESAIGSDVLNSVDDVRSSTESSNSTSSSVISVSVSLAIKSFSKSLLTTCILLLLFSVRRLLACLKTFVVTSMFSRFALSKFLVSFFKKP